MKKGVILNIRDELSFLSDQYSDKGLAIGAYLAYMTRQNKQIKVLKSDTVSFKAGCLNCEVTHFFFH